KRRIGLLGPYDADAGYTTIIESDSGNIVLTGDGAAQPKNNTAHGVQIQDAKIESTGTASIKIAGNGGGGTGGASAYGVRLAANALVQSANGDIEIVGVGGDAAGGSNFGV